MSVDPPRFASARPRGGRVLAAFALIATLLAGCALLRERVDEPAPTVPTSGENLPTLTVVGDSLTADGGDLGGSSFGPTTWLYDVVAAGIPWAGGWARPGATTSDMLDHVRPVPEADVVVILAGTNDVALGIPFREIADNLRQIATTVGASRVIVASIPPLARLPEAPPAFNAQLAELANHEGWEFVDASAGLRVGEEWADGMTVDGVHPTADGQRVLGAALIDAIVAGAAPANDHDTGGD